jgi:hypothetical protein
MNENAPTRKQRLNLDTSASDYNIRSANHNISQKDHRAFMRLARKWAARGYYSTPSAALSALLECTDHV